MPASDKEFCLLKLKVRSTLFGRKVENYKKDKTALLI